MTSPSQRATGSPATGPAAHAKTFATAALLTFACGMLVLIGYVMVGGFGFFLGLVGTVFGVLWWKDLHGTVFPKDIPAKSLVILAASAAALFGLAVAMA
ncbi:hypothetical protein [Saccharomonospora saliphila]|uniref:hypothetical protein n=1 Tax=Saccharomonospora saliphila TaxID=369829 RepID=UPI0003A9A757|nr:hypothetical protein [Saccharomonospora saliphila]